MNGLLLCVSSKVVGRLGVVRGFRRDDEAEGGEIRGDDRRSVAGGGVEDEEGWKVEG